MPKQEVLISIKLHQLILNNLDKQVQTCEISCSHCGKYEDGSFLGYGEVWSRWSRPTFQRCGLHPSSGRWRRQYAPLKRRSTSTRLHGSISQKAVIFRFKLSVHSAKTKLASDRPTLLVLLPSRLSFIRLPLSRRSIELAAVRGSFPIADLGMVRST
jgi:hypothetical protein